MRLPAKSPWFELENMRWAVGMCGWRGTDELRAKWNHEYFVWEDSFRDKLAQMDFELTKEGATGAYFQGKYGVAGLVVLDSFHPDLIYSLVYHDKRDTRAELVREGKMMEEVVKMYKPKYFK